MAAARAPDELTTTQRPGRLSLTAEEKRALYRDGYIILKGVVPKEITQAARERIKAAKREHLTDAKELTDLVNRSNITPILNDLIGYFDPPSRCQVGVLPPRKASSGFQANGYRDKNVPYFGASMHIDGSCTIVSGIPQDPKIVQDMTPEQKYRYFINAGKDPRTGKPLNEGKAPEAHHGRPQVGESCMVLGENAGVPLFNDRECTLSIGSFTAFLFVALNDQTRPGCGQTALLKGSHHAVEKFFQMQRAAGGIVGIEGPGWDRLNYQAENGLGINYLPAPVLDDEFTDESKHGPLERTADGVVWPRPQQILMEEGDACLTVFHVAHSGTRNEHGTEPRQSIIFRIRAKAHNPNVVVNGVSDHLDRGQWGQWLDPGRPFHPSNNFVDHTKDLEKEWVDPFERSKHLLCHPWEVWVGMRDVVAEERAKETTSEQASKLRSRL
eukprot:CAMPEP_0175559442 /NCGR_PEP_ID=MMETSP0096-20121207/36404_1 /TAXON_ID=311494 /ORGANISM="Alexandrium monilatum, Strain CCMP3105" /LENGTH=440 /DNA_ID=CAMNT_0016862645 /DNA_START=1 /DNA_END=1324 /DNA_ORIENTATION=+